MSQPALLIDCHKIINWLEDRKKLPKDWYNYEKAAEEKIKILLKDHQQYAQNQQLSKYLKQNTENFHFCDVVFFTQQILKTKWAENKSLVFGFSDKRVKQWTNLKKFMESRLTGVVNIAKFISQGLNFDLPSLDKNVELLDNQVANLKRKIDFNQNTIFQQEKQATNQRIKLGLSTDKNISVASQIPSLIQETPKLFQQTYENCKKIEKYYSAFLNYCQQNECAGNTLPLLQFFLINGDDFVVKYQQQQSAGQAEQSIPDQAAKYSEFTNWQPVNEWGIQIQGISAATKDKPINIQTILEARSTRIELLQDLNQLLYFYRSLQSNKGLQEESCISFVQSQIEQSTASIQSLLGTINGDISKRVELKNNVKVYQILLKQFKNYEQNIEQMGAKSREYRIEIEEMSQRREVLVRELRKLRGRLVQSKNHCEKYLSEAVKREVRVTGEINKLQ